MRGCLLLALACRAQPEPEPDPGLAPAAVSGPDVAEVDDLPLSRLLTVTASVPSRLVVEVAGLRITWPDTSVSHEVPLLGLKPSGQYELSVWLVDDEGRSSQAYVREIETEPLPDRFPQMDVLEHDVDRLEPGYRMANVKLVDGIDWHVIWDVVDLQVAWLYTGSPAFGDARMTEQGTLLGLMGVPTEVDMLMRPLRRWAPTPAEPYDLPLPVSYVHHELSPVEDGSMLTLSTGQWTSDAYPSSYQTPDERVVPAQLADDRVIRFDADGGLVWDWSIAERLDDGRIGFDSLDVLGTGYDWGHTNAVIPHPDGGIIVSVRHQDALVKLDPDGETDWILGDPAGWAPEFEPLLLRQVGSWPWPYHAHGPALDADGTLVVFDNHNEGHTPYTDPPPDGWWSRVAGYRIDEGAGTVEEVWSYEPPQRLLSPALGNARPLPITGNVLADFGFVDTEDGVLNTDVGRGNKSIRLIELVPGSSAPAPLDLRLWTPEDVDPRGVKAFRAGHVPSLYPPDVTVERVDP